MIIMEYLFIGKLVNTHGIKGEVRLLSDFRYKKEVFKKNFTFYIGNDKKEFIVENYRPHKKFDMFIFKGYYDINAVEYLKGSNVYINKEDLILKENKILAVDLIGFSVIIDGKKVGFITKTIDTLANEVLVLDNDIMIPYVNDFIININKEKEEIIIKNVKGLIP